MMWRWLLLFLRLTAWQVIRIARKNELISAACYGPHVLLIQTRAMVTETRIGRRFCVILLDKLAVAVEVEDETQKTNVFEMGCEECMPLYIKTLMYTHRWRIFEAIIDNDHVHSLMTLTHMYVNYHHRLF